MYQAPARPAGAERQKLYIRAEQNQLGAVSAPAGGRRPQEKGASPGATVPRCRLCLVSRSLSSRSMRIDSLRYLSLVHLGQVYCVHRGDVHLGLEHGLHDAQELEPFDLA